MIPMTAPDPSSTKYGIVHWIAKHAYDMLFVEHRWYSGYNELHADKPDHVHLLVSKFYPPPPGMTRERHLELRAKHEGGHGVIGDKHLSENDIMGTTFADGEPETDVENILVLMDPWWHRVKDKDEYIGSL